LTENSDKPLRIVIPCDTFPPDINGAARFAERLAGGLARRGHDIHIVAPAYSKDFGAFKEVHDGALMTVHRVKSHKIPQHPNLRWVMPFGLTRQMKNLLLDLQPDTVHIQSHMLIGRFALLAAKKLNIRSLATNHIMPENLVRYSVIIPKFLWSTAMKWSWADAGRVLRKADFVTTPTKRAAELLEAATGITGVLAISCGIDASKFENSKPPSNTPPRILFLGRLDFEKQIHNLLRAVALLPKELATVVELVGDGSERHRLEELAFELGIRPQVIFSGHISEAELPRAYERATLFAMPSIAELQSIATMEAMASGRPIVAADAMALPHLVHDGDNGYLFPPDDVEVFADRLKRVLTASPEELERLSENSLHLIRSHDIQRTLTIFEGLYRGDLAAPQTSDDNAPDYAKPIGRLNDALHQQIISFRQAQAEFKSKTNVVRERIFGLTEEVASNIDELRTDVVERARAVDKTVRQQVKKAAEKLKREDD
jgi:glycosyltransferase involved in cell wall biosynthesis